MWSPTKTFPLVVLSTTVTNVTGDGVVSPAAVTFVCAYPWAPSSTSPATAGLTSAAVGAAGTGRWR